MRYRRTYCKCMQTRLPHTKYVPSIIISVLIFRSLRRPSLPRRKLRRRRRARRAAYTAETGSRKKGQSDDPRTKKVSVCRLVVCACYYLECIYTSMRCVYLYVPTLKSCRFIIVFNVECVVEYNKICYMPYLYNN